MKTIVRAFVGGAAGAAGALFLCGTVAAWVTYLTKRELETAVHNVVKAARGDE